VRAAEDPKPTEAREEQAGRRPAEVWLVRHGETEWARDLRHTGRTDIALTAKGRAEARQVGRRLAGVPFDLVLSSPLSRALDTARLAGFGDRARVDADLVEWDYGRFEGLTTREIRRSRPGWSLWRDGAEGGESPTDVGRRADRALGAIASIEGRVLVFSHGHFLRTLAVRWLGLEPSDGRLLALYVATVSVLGWEHETRVVERWNEACPPG
jgi:probable phosphoglycerate mutase